MSTKTKKPVIAVDIDDVLADSAQGFVRFSNERWGTNLTVDDYDERWSIMWGVDIEEEKRRANVIHGSKIVSNFSHIEEALQVLRKLKRRYRLVIITSRVRFVEKETKDWIDKHYKGIFDTIRHAGFYDELKENSHHHTKAEICQEIGADYLIDDHPKHCFATAEAGIPALMFGDYVWSRDLNKLPKGVTRVKNWQEVLEFFDEERQKTV